MRVRRFLLQLLGFGILCGIGILLLQRGIQQRDGREGGSSSSSSSSSAPALALVPQTLRVPDKFRSGVFATSRILSLPQGYSISVFAAGLSKPRFLDIDDDGNLFITDIRRGAVYRLADTDRDGVADNLVEWAKGLRSPHGIDWYRGDLYVGEEHQIVVYRDANAERPRNPKEVLVPHLPSGEGHVTRTVVIGPDEHMYVSIGSSCNICEESDERRAAVMRFKLDGSDGTIFAKGIRNAVGLAFSPSFQLLATDNGRDYLGDDLPPEEIDVVDEGKNYGWPYCYGNRIPDPGFADRRSFCAQTEPPIVEMPAHSAPLGLTVAPDGAIIVAFHGSWNRSVPTGYKIVRVANGGVDDFITGWLQPNGKSWGRPVGVLFTKDGTLYITDDSAGAIYRVTRGS